MEDDKRLKRLLFQSQHRGFNEMDQLLTAFARAELQTLTEQQLAQYEALLEVPDWDIFSWLVGQAPPPAQHSAMVALIQGHMAKAGFRQ